ncbi:DUF2953 domain-containing protein [[Clostridium] polysaccharolyticum]|uniref:DUF2953 domain-containing protein n=1 Tax=[Clostridium] polysaccharolyticum TaxID=29364 RepID=A0A1I0B2H3_9FIRM|nr:DUF2953 domain-containing protein [[Clostridium] polysaccharolyticum]SET00689.1 Protein of unknown function [[Clostridium] polysaccharolyticum]
MLLGFLLVLIVLVLIVPLRYRFHLQVNGKTNVDLCVSWLFHLVHITIQYKEKKTKYCLRIFGLPVRKNKEENENQKVSQARKKKKQKKRNKSKTKTNMLMQRDSKQQSQKRNVKSGAKEEKHIAKEESAAKAEKSVAKEEELNFFRKVKDWLKKAEKMLLQIPETWTKIKNKISGIMKKKDKILEFLKDEGNRNSVKKLKKRSFEVLRYIGPRKLNGYVRFGTGDPSSTGKILGIISILRAYVKMNVSVYPDFEEKRIEADITAQGRMRVIRFIRVGGSLYFDKEVKKFFADGKQLKEELNG